MRWLKRDELLPGVICLTKVMSRRWKPAEETALAEVKRILKVELAERPQFPEGNVQGIAETCSRF
jgi:hypothetical protein